MEGRNKKILVLVLMMSSVLLLSRTAQAADEKAAAPKAADKKGSEKAGAPKSKESEKAGAPKSAAAPKSADKKDSGKASAPKGKSPAPAPGGGGGGGGGAKWESQKLIEKIITSKEKIPPPVKESCGRTENTQTCERTVMEMNRDQPKELNPKTITALQLKAMKDVLGLASKDCESAGKDKTNTTCAGSYKKAGDEMATMSDATEIADINAKITLVQGVMKHVQTCQTELDNEKADNSPLKEVNNFLLKTGENAVALATAIATKSLKVDKK